MAPPVGTPADLEALRLPAVGRDLELGSWWLPESLAAELGGFRRLGNEIPRPLDGYDAKGT